MGDVGASGEFLAVPDSVAWARERVTGWLRAADADELMVGDIAIAVSEACTNVVLHAYRDDDDAGSFRITAAQDAGVVEVTVTDDGQGVRPRHDSPGLGLGLALIGVLSDWFEIGPAAGGRGTMVCMQFSAAGAASRTSRGA